MHKTIFYILSGIEEIVNNQCQQLNDQINIPRSDPKIPIISIAHVKVAHSSAFLHIHLQQSDTIHLAQKKLFSLPNENSQWRNLEKYRCKFMAMLIEFAIQKVRIVGIPNKFSKRECRTLFPVCFFIIIPGVFEPSNKISRISV